MIRRFPLEWLLGYIVAVLILSIVLGIRQARWLWRHQGHTVTEEKAWNEHLRDMSERMDRVALSKRFRWPNKS